MPNPRENESRSDFIGRCISDEEVVRDYPDQDQRFAFCNSRYGQVEKASGARPLYVFRPLLNAEEVIEWAKSSGFDTVLPPDEMHVTVVFSKTPFLWHTMEPRQDTLVVKGGLREVSPLGDKGAVVLKFDSPNLVSRWAEFRSGGASWDFVSYSPHATITYNGAGVNLDDMKPFDGDLVFGPEVFEDVDNDFASQLTEKAKPEGIQEQKGLDKRVSKSSGGLLAAIRELRDTVMGPSPSEVQDPGPVDVGKSHDYYVAGAILKVDEDQRVVYGWASVISENGEPVVDSQGDVIPPDEMVKSLNDFMLEDRVGKVMHTGGRAGTIIHSFPMTKEIAKSLGIETSREGTLVGYHVGDDDVWKRVKSGEFTGFSIGGEAKRIPLDE